MFGWQQNKNYCIFIFVKLKSREHVDLPISGTASEVDGTDSATMSENTLSDNRIVIPEGKNVIRL